jgi:hypothetical protein
MEVLNRQVNYQDIMRVLKIAIVLLIFSSIACKKENDYAIIEPGPYFPVYPNSWWKYIVNDSTLITYTTSNRYILHSYQASSDPVFVPFYNGQPIYKYDRIVSNAFGTHKWPILSEIIGFSFTVNPESQYPEYNEMATVKAKIFDGQDSVLIIVGTFFWGVDYPQVTFPEKRYSEFVKDVGLVKDVIYDTITNDTSLKKILIDYHIGPEIILSAGRGSEHHKIACTWAP